MSSSCFCAVKKALNAAAQSVVAGIIFGAKTAALSVIAVLESAVAVTDVLAGLVSAPLSLAEDALRSVTAVSRFIDPALANGCVQISTGINPVTKVTVQLTNAVRDFREEANQYLTRSAEARAEIAEWRAAIVAWDEFLVFWGQECL